MAEQNLFIQVHAKRIEKMLYDLESFKMQGGYGGSLNLAEIQMIIRGLCNEISKQRSEINDLMLKLQPPIVSERLAD